PPDGGTLLDRTARPRPRSHSRVLTPSRRGAGSGRGWFPRHSRPHPRRPRRARAFGPRVLTDAQVWEIASEGHCMREALTVRVGGGRLGCDGGSVSVHVVSAWLVCRGGFVR